MKPSHRRCLLLAAALLLGSVLPASAADQTATWNSTTGNWSDFTKWNTNPLFPNNGNGGFTFDAIQNGGALTVNQAITVEKFTLNGGTNTGGGFALTVNDALTLAGGQLNGSGTINALGGGSLVGMEMSGRTINFGDGSGPTFDTTWTSGNLLAHGGMLINNRSDSNFIVGFDGTFFNINRSGSMVFNNEGTFTKNGGSGTATIGGVNNGDSSFDFNNNGLVQVNSGTLAIINATYAGAFQIASGATLDLVSTATLSTGITFSGAGTVNFSGILTASAATTVDSNLNFTGSLHGSGPVTVNGNLTFTGKMESGTNLTATGTVTLNGGGREINSAVLNLGDGAGPDAGSTTNWSSGNILMRSPSTINNRSDSVINATGNNTLFSNTGGLGFAFNNEGTFNQNGTGTTTIADPILVNNTGTINVNSGTLAITGLATQHSGATLTGGTWNVNNGATLNYSAGSNITTLGSAASVTLDGAGSSFAKVTTALATNQGSFTLKNNRDLTTAGAYTNSGTTRVEDSTTTMTIGSSGSAAYTQTVGETVLVGGAIIDASVFNLNGGELKGSGTIASSVVTGGTNTIAPGLSPGVLTIDGDLTLSAGSTLTMELGGLNQGTDYDFLDVNGTLTLAGLLDLDFLNDFQNSLPNGEMLTLATANSAILGSFANVSSGGYVLTSHAIPLQVWYGIDSPFGAENLVVGVPEPSRAVLLLLGLGGMLLQRKRHACAVDSAAL